MNKKSIIKSLTVLKNEEYEAHSDGRMVTKDEVKLIERHFGLIYNFY